jgi:hypothetical protein
MSLELFESSLLTNVVDLTTFKKAEPIKTTEERRAEWLQQRRGKFTASEFHRLMAYPNKAELPAGAKTYALEKAVEIMSLMDDTEKYISVDMAWGIEHELEAIAAFTELTGIEPYNTGDNQKSLLLGDDVSCTPDGLIQVHSGIEVKCPKSKTHFQYSLLKNADDLKRECPEYYWQCMGSMYVAGRESWHFVSYDPRYKEKRHQLHTFELVRNEDDIALLDERLLMAVEHRNRLLMAFDWAKK